MWKFSTGAQVFSSPCLFEANNSSYILCGSHDHNLYCLDRASGQSVWKLDVGAPVNSSPCVSFWKDTQHTAQTATTQTTTAQTLISTSTAHTSIADIDTPQTTVKKGSPVIVVTNIKGDIFLVSGDSGQVLDKTHIDGEIFSSPVLFPSSASSPFSSSSSSETELRLVVGSRNNKVYCFAL